jgi:hypothetical protein
MVQPLVVVVDGDAQHLFGVVLPDHVVIENAANFPRRRHAVLRLDEVQLVLFTDDIHAQLDALVADEHGRSGDQLAHLVLALSAEGAVEGGLGITAGGVLHGDFSLCAEASRAGDHDGRSSTAATRDHRRLPGQSCTDPDRLQPPT